MVRIASGAGLMLIAALCSGISCGATGADCATAGSCLGVFEATIEDDAGNEYFLGGDTLRTFGVGSEPFATGTYTELTTNAVGTFAFDEGGFRISD